MSETREPRASWLHARFAPSSFDAEARTIEVVWSTGAPVRRRDWEGEYLEQLDMGADAVDLTRLNGGAPVLNSHDAWDLDGVLGVVERAWLDKGEGRATLRFSEREKVAPIIADVRDGIIRNISVGYDVTEWQEGKTKEGVRIKRAARWQPAEISLVPIPADASAQVRAAETPAGDGTSKPTSMEARMAEDAPKVPEAPAPTINRDEVVKEARAAERARVAEIRSIAQLATRSLLTADAVAVLEQKAIAEDTAPDAFRSALFETAAQATDEQRAPTPRVTDMGRSGDDPAQLLDAMATAIAVRAMPEAFRDLKDDRHRSFMAVKPTDMVLEMLAARGERISPRDRGRLLERAFHTTSDFPLLLEAAANKMLQAGYNLAAPTYRAVFARRSFNDFKPHKFLTGGEFPMLTELAEGGEIKYGTMSEKRETVTPKTFAAGIGLTRQLLVNDDLSQFTDFTGMIGAKVATFENKTAYDLLNLASGDGPSLVEGAGVVFSTGRGNKAGTPSTIDITNVALGRAAIMKQKTIDGSTISVGQRMRLLCGPDKELVARQMTSAIVPNVTTNVNVWQSFLDPVVEPLVSGNHWYLFADPAAQPIYVYGYVAGREQPQVRVFNPVQGRDALVIEVVHDFGVGAIDWRGGWHNSGA